MGGFKGAQIIRNILPISEVQIDDEFCFKGKQKGINLTITNSFAKMWYWQRFSRYSQILWLVAWILSCHTNSRKSSNKLEGKLSVAELEVEEQKFLKIVNKSHSIKRWNPCWKVFNDNEGLVKLKTKIIKMEKTNKTSAVS